ncbi:MAG: glutaredoxin family protein [Dehalococcoidia bacterium]|nr:glutaredoxin family protein [Dehalococcoidia bacterium]
MTAVSESVIVYSSDNCVPCEWVKKYLQRKGVPFTVFNVSHDQKALQELQELGFSGTPVTVIKGQTFTGFNQKKLEEALVAAGYLAKGEGA